MRTSNILLLIGLLAVCSCGSDDNDGSGAGTDGGTATISGQLLNGGALAPPLQCVVHTYYQLLDPSAPDFGSKFAVSEPVSVEAWPQAYEIQGVTALGVGWYVGAQCDTNGDSVYDVGGWYPDATPTLVKAPATGIDITIQP